MQIGHCACVGYAPLIFIDCSHHEALWPTLHDTAATITLTLKRLGPAHDAVDLNDLGEQGWQVLQAQHVRAIGGSMVGVGVDLHE
jgi:hypothetical protein